jgi:glycosidase
MLAISAVHRHRLLPVVAAGLLLALPAIVSAQPPTVTKVDPPNWFTGHTWNPVRVLVRGERLHAARVEASAPGVRTGLVRVNERGTALFVDVHVDPPARPGPAPLRITTPAGVVTAAFELTAPLPRAGRFQGFGNDDVIYLVMPDRFANGDRGNDDPAKSRGILNRQKGRYYHGGDLQGIIDRLPYLADLGITALWLNPVYDNADHPDYNEVVDGEAATDYHGFHAIDYYAVEERLGDMATLRELVDRAHALGIKVIQDQVANHTCGFHPWVEDPPTPTWFNGSKAQHLANTFQTHPLMDPRSPEPVTRATLDGWFVDILPDLNQRDEDVARYLIQNSLWWVGMTGLDGIRQDTLPYVPRDFWRDWMAALKREHPDLKVIGEVLDGSPAFVAFFQTGRAQFDGVDSGIDTLFDYPLYYGVRRAFAQGESITAAVNVLHQDGMYPAPDALVTLLGSHDVPRFMNEPGATIDGLKLATTFLLTTRGTPKLYYGDEIAMRGGGDPDNRRDFPGGWPGDARSAFEAAGRTPEEQAVFAHTQRMLRLRKELAPLRRGTLTHLAITSQFYAFARVHDGERVVVALNNDTRAARVAVDIAPLGLAEGTTLTDRLGAADDAVVSDGRVAVTLPARAGAVFVVR